MLEIGAASSVGHGRSSAVCSVQTAYIFCQTRVHVFQFLLNLYDKLRSITIFFSCKSILLRYKILFILFYRINFKNNVLNRNTFNLHILLLFIISSIYETPVFLIIGTENTEIDL